MHDAPVIRIVRGTPTAEEVAALLGVLALRRPQLPAPSVGSRWARSGRPGGGTWRPAPGAWRHPSIKTS